MKEYKRGSMIIKLNETDIDIASGFLNRLFSDDYQKENPCPDCGSHNVEIDIGGLGDGYLFGEEWCNDCGWQKETSTLPDNEGDDE